MNYKIEGAFRKNKKTFILIQSSSKSVNPDYGFALFLALKTKIWLWQLSEKVS